MSETRITFRFRQSRADDLAWWIELANRGTYRTVMLSPRLTIHEASFDVLDPIALSHALSLACALVHDKKAEAFSGSSRLHMCTVREVLRCYQHSLQVDEPQAYCSIRVFYIDHSSSVRELRIGERPDLWFPCRLGIQHANRIHPDQPGTIAEQVQAALVRAETSWCPRLTTRDHALNVMLERHRS